MSLVKKNNDIWLPSIFDEILGSDVFGGTTLGKMNNRVPAVNIIESDDDFILEVAAPGISKENFNIELDNDVLTISSNVKSDTEEKKDKYTRREFVYGVFKRAFTLPESADVNNIGAAYENGVLLVTIPKKEEAKAPEKKLIEVL